MSTGYGFLGLISWKPLHFLEAGNMSCVHDMTTTSTKWHNATNWAIIVLIVHPPGCDPYNYTIKTTY